MPYVPDASDIVWIDFDLQAGHEQAGHRPASVVLADQVKSFDWWVRGATEKGQVTPTDLSTIRAKLRPLIG